MVPPTDPASIVTFIKILLGVQYKYGSPSTVEESTIFYPPSKRVLMRSMKFAPFVLLSVQAITFVMMQSFPPEYIKELGKGSKPSSQVTPPGGSPKNKRHHELVGERDVNRFMKGDQIGDFLCWDASVMKYSFVFASEYVDDDWSCNNFGPHTGPSSQTNPRPPPGKPKPGHCLSAHEVQVHYAARSSEPGPIPSAPSVLDPFMDSELSDALVAQGTARAYGKGITARFETIMQMTTYLAHASTSWIHGMIGYGQSNQPQVDQKNPRPPPPGKPKRYCGVETREVPLIPRPRGDDPFFLGGAPSDVTETVRNLLHSLCGLITSFVYSFIYQLGKNTNKPTSQVKPPPQKHNGILLFLGVIINSFGPRDGRPVNWIPPPQKPTKPRKNTGLISFLGRIISMMRDKRESASARSYRYATLAIKEPMTQGICRSHFNPAGSTFASRTFSDLVQRFDGSNVARFIPVQIRGISW